MLTRYPDIKSIKSHPAHRSLIIAYRSTRFSSPIKAETIKSKSRESSLAITDAKKSLIPALNPLLPSLIASPEPILAIYPLTKSSLDSFINPGLTKNFKAINLKRYDYFQHTVGLNKVNQYTKKSSIKKTQIKSTVSKSCKCKLFKKNKLKETVLNKWKRRNFYCEEELINTNTPPLRLELKKSNECNIQTTEIGSEYDFYFNDVIP